MGSEIMSVRAAVMFVFVCMCLSALAEQTALEEFVEIVKPLKHESGKTKTIPGKIDPIEPEDRAMFVPKDFKLPKVPLAAGNERNFRSETAAQKASATQALGVSRASSEKMRGLSIVTSIMKKREAAASIKHQDHVVAEKMNYAAERAAMFRPVLQLLTSRRWLFKKQHLRSRPSRQSSQGSRSNSKQHKPFSRRRRHNSEQSRRPSSTRSISWRSMPASTSVPRLLPLSWTARPKSAGTRPSR